MFKRVIGYYYKLILAKKTYKYMETRRVYLKKLRKSAMVTKSMTKEARIYNGEKTVSSIHGAEKTGQLYVNK